jgi:intracellular septation protein A
MIMNIHPTQKLKRELWEKFKTEALTNITLIYAVLEFKTID